MLAFEFRFECFLILREIALRSVGPVKDFLLCWFTYKCCAGWIGVEESNFMQGKIR